MMLLMQFLKFRLHCITFMAIDNSCNSYMYDILIQSILYRLTWLIVSIEQPHHYSWTVN